MFIKIQFKKETHIFKGEDKFINLQNFVKNTFKNTPKSYTFQYQDLDSDYITISCDEDLKTLRETSVSQNPEIFIIEEELKLSRKSSQEFEELIITEQYSDSEPEVLLQEKKLPPQSQQIQQQKQQQYEEEYKQYLFLKSTIQDDIKALVQQEIQQKLPFIIQQVKQSLQQETQNQVLIQDKQAKKNLDSQPILETNTVDSIIGQTTTKQQKFQSQSQKKKFAYTIKKVAQQIKEVLGGKKEDYFAVIELYKHKKTDQIIQIILQERKQAEKLELQNLLTKSKEQPQIHNQKKNQQLEEQEEDDDNNNNEPIYQLEDTFQEPQEYTQKLQESQPYSTFPLESKLAQVTEFTGYFDRERIKKHIIQHPQLPVERIIENVLTWIQESFQQQEQQQVENSLQEYQQQLQQQNQENKKKQLKKDFNFKVRAVSQQVSNVLGGEAETYYGVVDYLPSSNSSDDTVLAILEDQNLVDKHSSYK